MLRNETVGGAAARFAGPAGLALSPDGATLAVADAGNCAVRLVTLASGAVRTLAGSGAPGGNAVGAGTAAAFAAPLALAYTAAATLLLSDTGNHVLKNKLRTAASSRSG